MSGLFVIVHELISRVGCQIRLSIFIEFIHNASVSKGMFRMPGNTIEVSELEKLNITLEDQILEIGVQDDYADKIAAEYIEKLAQAKNDKESVLYKSWKIKERYRNSDLYKSINRIINQIEPLRVAILREKLALKQAVAESNKQIVDESMKAVAKKKLEKSKLEDKLNVLIKSTSKLQLAR